MTSIRHTGSRRGLATIETQAEFAVTGNTLEGYASVFGVEYPVSDMDGVYTEVVRPGAFRAGLRERKPIVQWAHGRDAGAGIGTIPIAELLQAKEDSAGLYYAARLHDVPQLALLKESIRTKQITGASFRFAVRPGGDRWSQRAGGKFRELTGIDTLELGPVLWGANPQASVTLRQNLDRHQGVAFIAEINRKMNARMAKAQPAPTKAPAGGMSRREIQRVALAALLK